MDPIKINFYDATQCLCVDISRQNMLKIFSCQVLCLRGKSQSGKICMWQNAYFSHKTDQKIFNILHTLHIKNLCYAQQDCPRGPMDKAWDYES